MRIRMVPASNSTRLAVAISGAATPGNGSEETIEVTTTTTITTRSGTLGGTEAAVSTRAVVEEEAFRNIIYSSSSSSNSGVEIIIAIQIADGVVASLAISSVTIRVAATGGGRVTSGEVDSRTFNSDRINSSRAMNTSWMAEEEEEMDPTGMASCSALDRVKGTETIQHKTKN